MVGVVAGVGFTIAGVLCFWEASLRSSNRLRTAVVLFAVLAVFFAIVQVLRWAESWTI
jgi:hypothetical protein